MTDIHTHILPETDDGSPSLEESLKMLAEEVRGGVTEIVLTPHYHPRRGYVKSAEELKNAFETFSAAAKSAGFGVALRLGQEIYYSTKIDVIGMLRRGELLTMNGTNQVLLEFSVNRPPDDFSDVGYRFSLYGYKVIIAHAEIYPWLDLFTLKSLKEDGCSVQINGGSLLGGAPRMQKMRAKALLRAGLVDRVASDIHSFRPCDWGKVKRKLKKYACGRDFFAAVNDKTQEVE